MKLGLLERFYVTGPWREWQRKLELQRFTKLHPFPQGGKVLEIGCGDGRGLVALQQAIQPSALTGLDLDPRMIQYSQQTLEQHQIKAELIEGSAATLPFADNIFDTAVSFGCIHHVPHWPDAIEELSRVVKKGGLLYAEEFYAPLLEAPIFKQLVPHPPQRFTHQQLIQTLKRCDFSIEAEQSLWGLAGFVVAKRV